jgi:hypothetical protein
VRAALLSALYAILRMIYMETETVDSLPQPMLRLHRLSSSRPYEAKPSSKPLARLPLVVTGSVEMARQNGTPGERGRGTYTRSASAQMATTADTHSTAQLPRSVSDPSRMASAPSSTALATSVASARVGRGLSVMLSHTRFTITGCEAGAVG